MFIGQMVQCPIWLSRRQW